MTINHPIRRHLARICSDRTMSRVVDPVLADMRWESGRPPWFGYLALAKALLIHATLSTPAVLHRTWSDDERAIPKAAGFVMAGALLAAVPLIAMTYGRTILQSHVSPFAFVLLLLPQALALTLPGAQLLAIPLAFRRQDPSSRLSRRTVVLSLCCVAATFVVMAWAVPEGNQAFRVMVSRQGLIPRGFNETSFAAVRDRIEVLKLTPGGRVAARPLEFDYHVRLVLICTPLPLGILALALSRSARGRRRPWAMGLAAMGGYVFVFFPLLIGARMLMRWSSLPPVLFAWTPILLLVIGAAGVFHHRETATPANPCTTLPPPGSARDLIS